MERYLVEFKKVAKSWSISELCKDCGIQLIQGRSGQQIDSVTSIANPPVSGALVLISTIKSLLPRLRRFPGWYA